MTEKMFEAEIKEGIIWKKIVDSLKDLLSECEWICDDDGIELQAMDKSHVSLVSVKIRALAFDHYRIDREVVLGNFSRQFLC